MGLVKTWFSKRSKNRLTKLPSGAFALDADGRLIVSTLPGSFPEARIREIGHCVLTFFRRAQAARVSVQELNVFYASLKVTARTLRGGAIIFVAPQSVVRSSPADGVSAQP